MSKVNVAARHLIGPLEEYVGKYQLLLVHGQHLGTSVQYVQENWSQVSGMLQVRFVQLIK